MTTEPRPAAAEAFYQANEALQDAEVLVFATLHKCLDLRISAHPYFRDFNAAPLSTLESYLEHVDEVHQKVLDDPHHPPTPQDFASMYAQQCIWMRHLAKVVNRWSDALVKFHTTFGAWAGDTPEARAGCAPTGLTELDFLSHGGASPAIALWLSVRLRLMNDRAGNCGAEKLSG